jgi:hypothetical protein
MCKILISIEESIWPRRSTGKPEIFEAYVQLSTTDHLEAQKVIHVRKVLARDTSAPEIIEPLESMAFRSFSSTRAVAFLRIPIWTGFAWIKLSRWGET